jgi:hypothetical protein
LKLKGKVLAGASALAMASGVIGLAAPAAHAVVTTVGSCTGQISLVKLTSPVKGQGITDQTVRGDKASGALAKDVSNPAKPVIGGTCSGVYRAGDVHVPSSAVGGGNTAVSSTLLTEATAVSGNASCANGATAQAVDATKNDAYPLNGKITAKFAATYTDNVTLATKNFTMQADIQALGFDAVQPDVLAIGGIVLSGVNAGALLETAQTGTASNVWFNPVVLAPKGTDPNTTMYKTGYNLDLGNAANCANGIANDVNLTLVLLGGGGTSATSGLGSTTNGLIFEFGAP